MHDRHDVVPVKRPLVGTRALGVRTWGAYRVESKAGKVAQCTGAGGARLRLGANPGIQSLNVGG